jgi:hypothetical protein
MDPTEAVDELGAQWSPSFDDYAAGRIDASQIRCVLCRLVPCGCPPFGTPEYLDLVRALHGK